MASEERLMSPARNDSTVVTRWPQPFDTKNDISLDAALQTRGMLRYIQQREVTREDLERSNPFAIPQDVDDILQSTFNERQRQLSLAAANLANMLKMEAMSQTEQEEVNAYANTQDAVGMYELIHEHIDLKGGRAQDKLRQRFVAMKVTPNDSVDLSFGVPWLADPSPRGLV
jgi:hypothetical protein